MKLLYCVKKDEKQKTHLSQLLFFIERKISNFNVQEKI
jgi:hypothetical protein